jgi:hypothetical protein
MNKEVAAAHFSDLIRRIERLEAHCFSGYKPNNFSNIDSIQPFPFQWTASKADLIELIYSLQSGGVLNNGKTGIKETAETFQRLFQVDLGNYYNVFNEIRLRKKNRTSLLDLLREKVLQKMDSLDEKLNS